MNMPSYPGRKVRKPILDMIEELKSWLPNYDHGPKDYPTLLWRILASAPGGDEAEGMGYEPFSLGWQEIEQLGNVLTVIQDTRDVEDLIQGLLGDEEELEEARRSPRGPARPQEDPGTYINSATDIRTWVYNSSPANCVEMDACDAVADAIRAADHPDYGHDWAPWLDKHAERIALMAMRPPPPGDRRRGPRPGPRAQRRR